MRTARREEARCGAMRRPMARRLAPPRASVSRSRLGVGRSQDSDMCASHGSFPGLPPPLHRGGPIRTSSDAQPIAQLHQFFIQKSRAHRWRTNYKRTHKSIKLHGSRLFNFGSAILTPKIWEGIFHVVFIRVVALPSGVTGERSTRQTILPNLG